MNDFEKEILDQLRLNAKNLNELSKLFPKFTRPQIQKALDELELKFKIYFNSSTDRYYPSKSSIADKKFESPKQGAPAAIAAASAPVAATKITTSAAPVPVPEPDKKEKKPRAPVACDRTKIFLHIDAETINDLPDDLVAQLVGKKTKAEKAKARTLDDEILEILTASKRAMHVNEILVALFKIKNIIKKRAALDGALYRLRQKKLTSANDGLHSAI